MYRLLLIASAVAVPGLAAADTWDEPWHDTVIRDATALVRAKQVAVDKNNVVRCELVKHIAGQPVPATFRLTGLVSHHSGPQIGAEQYLFVGETDEPDTYEVITPTAAMAPITPAGVHATYRHSYHQALVPEDLYESTQRAMFNAAHREPYDAELIRGFIRDQLGKEPGALGSDAAASATFFRQHVALELVFHLRGAGIEPAELRRLIEPFLPDPGVHTQISAARALGIVGPDSRLCRFLEAEREGFAKIMAVWGLRDRGTSAGKTCLETYLPDADTGETGFGGNVMDPRIGTRFPGSVRAAVKQTLDNWPPPTTGSSAAPAKPAAPAARTQPPPAAAPKQQGCGHCASSGSDGSPDAALLGLAIAATLRRRRKRRQTALP